MKKLVFLAACALAVVLPKAAKADTREGYYVSGFAAASFLEDVKRNRVRQKFDTGFVGTLALGWGWCNGIRVELEGGYRYNKLKAHDRRGSSSFRAHGHIDTWTLFGNAYYDFDTCWCIQPYLGFGIGWAKQELHARRFHHDKNRWAGQVIAGASYTLNCNSDLFVEYRFFKTTHKDFKDHNVGAGLRYYF